MCIIIEFNYQIYKIKPIEANAHVTVQDYGVIDFEQMTITVDEEFVMVHQNKSSSQLKIHREETN